MKKSNPLVDGQVYLSPKMFPKALRYFLNLFIIILVVCFVGLLVYGFYLKPLEFLILFAVFFLAFWLLLRIAPSGYQDKDGFHEIDEKKDHR